MPSQPFVHRGRSLGLALLSALVLATLVVYLLGGSVTPTLAARYVRANARTETVSGMVRSAHGHPITARAVTLVFRDARGAILQRVTPRRGTRFSVPVSSGARTVNVTINSVGTRVSRRYELRRGKSLELRAAFPARHSMLLPALFPQMG